MRLNDPEHRALQDTERMIMEINSLRAALTKARDAIGQYSDSTSEESAELSEMQSAWMLANKILKTRSVVP